MMSRRQVLQTGSVAVPAGLLASVAIAAEDPLLALEAERAGLLALDTRGLTDEQYRPIFERINEIEYKIIATEPVSLSGLAVQARLLRYYLAENGGITAENAHYMDDRLLIALTRNIEQMALTA